MGGLKIAVGVCVVGGGASNRILAFFLLLSFFLTGCDWFIVLKRAPRSGGDNEGQAIRP